MDHLDISKTTRLYSFLIDSVDVFQVQMSDYNMV